MSFDIHSCKFVNLSDLTAHLDNGARGDFEDDIGRRHTWGDTCGAMVSLSRFQKTVVDAAADDTIKIIMPLLRQIGADNGLDIFINLAD